MNLETLTNTIRNSKLAKNLKKQNYRRIAVLSLNTVIAGVSLLILLNSLSGSYYKQEIQPGKDDMLPAVVFLLIIIILRYLIKSRDKKSFKPNKIARIVHRKRWVGLVLLLLFVISYYSMYINSWDIAKDAFLHYVFLRSLFFDGDLHFTNDYSHVGGPSFYLNHDTGYWVNPFSIGSSILWSPFFLAGHSFAKLSGMESEGYGNFPYVFSLSLGSLVYAWLGLVFLISILQRWFNDKISVLIGLVIWYATPLTFYTNQQPFFSHPMSFFTSVLFLQKVLKIYDKPTSTRWMTAGVAGGLMMLVRPQNGVFLVIPAILLIMQLKTELKKEYNKDVIGVIKWGGLFSIFLLATFLPQMITWQIMYNTPFTVPQGKTFMEWGNPKLLQVLFSTNHGLFVWTPVFIFSVIGLIFFFAKTRIFTVGISISLFLMLYVNSTPHDWWGGNAFGARRFTSSLPYFAIGLAALLNLVWSKKTVKYAMIFILLFLMVWNISMISAYSNSIIPHAGEIELSKMVSSTASRMTKIVKDIPGGAVEAVYILFNKNAGWHSHDIRLKHPETMIRMSEHSRYLRNGWSKPRLDPGLGKNVRIATRNIASINFYCKDTKKDLQVQVRTLPLNMTNTILPVINGISLQPVRLINDWQTASFTIPSMYVHDGTNLIRLDCFWEYNSNLKPLLKSNQGEFLEVEYIIITAIE